MMKRYRVDLRIKGVYRLRFVLAENPYKARMIAKQKYHATDIVSVTEV